MTTTDTTQEAGRIAVSRDDLTQTLTEFWLTVRWGGGHQFKGQVADPAEVADALHATLSRIAAERAPDVQAAEPPVKADPMWEQAYMDVQKVLDKALGTEEEDGTGGGIASEVWLLAHQRDEARADLAKAGELIRQLERITTAWTRGMYSAWIDCWRGDVKAAIECLSEGLDGYDGTEWDGTETGAEWRERTKAEESL
jgi:hypothetical protein